MPAWLGLALLGASALAALAWLALLLDPAQAWRMRPVAEDEPRPADPPRWPSVAVLIPAHDEEEVIADTVPTLLAQNYRGEWAIVVVDERSTDATAALARAQAHRHPKGTHLTVVSGQALPRGWVGKVWGLEQAYRATQAARPDYYLLTDADISHAPTSLSTLVAESEAADLALNSRMARLHCESFAERLLIPAFVFFFNVLYPMRRVNEPRSAVSACAGGCVLLRAGALATVGGFEPIKGELIDDVNLARVVAQTSPRLRLSISRSDVRSLREYSSIGPLWRMIRRTAFTELRHSWWRLAGTVGGMLILFLLPMLTLPFSVALAGALASGASNVDPWLVAAMGGASLLALVLMHIAYRPAVALFGLGSSWAWTLGVAGSLYGAMTADSARQHVRGRGQVW